MKYSVVNATGFQYDYSTGGKMNKNLVFDLLAVNKLLAFGNIVNSNLLIDRRYFDSCRTSGEDHKQQSVTRLQNSCHMLKQFVFLKKENPTKYKNIDITDILLALDFEECNSYAFTRFSKVERITFQDSKKKTETSFVRFLKSSSMTAKKKQVFYIREDCSDDLNERVTLNIEKYITDKICIPKFFSATGLALSSCAIFDELKLKPDEICVVRDKEKIVTVDEAITAICGASLEEMVRSIKDLLKDLDKDRRWNTADREDFEFLCRNLFQISQSEDVKNITNSFIKSFLELIGENNAFYFANNFRRIRNVLGQVDFNKCHQKSEWFKVRVTKFRTKTTYFDGEGLMSQDFCEKINKAIKNQDESGYKLFSKEDRDYECNSKTNLITGSVQIRLPFIKGTLHCANLALFFKDKGIQTIKGLTYFPKPSKTVSNYIDAYCKKHNLDETEEDNYKYKDYDVSKLKVILTENQFKFINSIYLCRMFESELEKGDKTPIECFFQKLYDLNYGIGINNIEPYNEGMVQMNYEFWSTLPLLQPRQFFQEGLCDEEFKQARSKKFQEDLNIICKDTDEHIQKYADPEYLKSLLINSENEGYLRLENDYLAADERFFFTSELGKEFIKTSFDSYINDVLRGRIKVPGERRFLSSDLLFLLYQIIGQKIPPEEMLQENMFFAKDIITNNDSDSQHYEGKPYLVLRAPHYCRNEIVVSYRNTISKERDRYFKNLRSVIMFNPKSLNAERLGGADFDGDVIYLLTSNVIDNKAANLSTFDGVEHKILYPIVLIPSLKAKPKKLASKPIIDSWRLGFDSKIGEISNTCFAQVLELYKEPLEGKDINLMSFYTLICGISIDAKKTGIAPSKYEIEAPVNKFAEAYINAKDNLKNIDKEIMKNEDDNQILVALIKRYKNAKLPEINTRKLMKETTVIENKTLNIKQRKDDLVDALEKCFLHYGYFDYINSYKKLLEMRDFLICQIEFAANKHNINIDTLSKVLSLKNSKNALNLYRGVIEKRNPNGGEHIKERNKDLEFKSWHYLLTAEEKLDALLKYDLKNEKFVKYLNVIKSSTPFEKTEETETFRKVFSCITDFKNKGYKTFYHLLMWKRVEDILASKTVEKYKLLPNYLLSTITTVKKKALKVGFSEEECKKCIALFCDNLDRFMHFTYEQELKKGDDNLDEQSKIDLMENALDEFCNNVPLDAINAITHNGIKNDKRICQIFASEILGYIEGE